MKQELASSNINRMELYRIGVAKYKESDVYYKNFKLLEEEYISTFNSSKDLLREQVKVMQSLKSESNADTKD